MKKLKKGERGFTLIEILVVVVLIGILTGGITATISQVLTVNTRASNRMVAVRQVQQAGDRVSKDVLQAQSVELVKPAEYPPGTKFPLSLNWTDSDDLKHVVVYTIDDGELKRSHTVNGVPQATAPHVVARYIDVTIDPATEKAKTNCYWDDVRWVLTFKVTATVGGQSETRVYEVKPRPG